ncbi:MAG: UvrD-helicase domain-containing protein [Bacteroidia bacterium]|nr:UvrD-helicase domain-containing protein [Bacteroidia bacterium]
MQQVLLASAGAGKTQELAKAVSTCLAQNPQVGVLAITFTRNAAAELRSRILSHLLQTNQVHLARQLLLGQLPLYTSTIDAFIRHLYLFVAPFLGIVAYSDLIVEEAEELEVARLLSRELLAQLHKPQLFAAVQRQFEEAITYTSRRLSLERFLQRQVLQILQVNPIRLFLQACLSQWHRQAPSSEAAYKKLFVPLETDEALFDFLRLLLNTYRKTRRKLFLQDLQSIVLLIARTHEELLSEHTRFYNHLFIDEAQDTALHQWEILWPILRELTSREDTSLTLIGDPKQSIYGWREADYRYLLGFGDFWRNAHYRTLEANWRSHPTLVAFNNHLYTELPKLLKQGIQANKSRRPYYQAALEAVETLYAPERVKQKPCREAQKSAQVRLHVLEGISSKAQERQARQQILLNILDFLRQEKVPPDQTAFLVRTNAQIEEILDLLKGYPLQVAAQSLGQCPSLAVSFRVLQGEKGPVEEHYLNTTATPQIHRQLEYLRTSGLEPSRPPLEKWWGFYELFRLWQEAGHTADRLFWSRFLSELYLFWQQQPYEGLEAVCLWWEMRMRHLILELPPAPDAYPVLTIHRAKGLEWEAVILPFAEWPLFSARWDRPLWRRVPLAYLPDSLRQILMPWQELLRSQISAPWQKSIGHEGTIELPVKASSQTDEATCNLGPFLYEEFFTERVVENINLHYVATTRARRFLFLIAKADKRGGGIGYWQAFWTENAKLLNSFSP